MSSINKKEIEKFSKMATEWWDPNGKFKPLHKFNPIRIKYIKENIINDFKLKNKTKPLDKIDILDVGCASGNFINYCKTTHKWNSFGVEPSKGAYDLAVKKNKKNIYI